MEIMSTFVGISNNIQTRLHGVAVHGSGTGISHYVFEENM